MSTPNDPRSKALSLLAGFTVLNGAQVLANRSPTSVWHMLPTSLGIPPHNNEEHNARVEAIKSVLTAFPVYPLETTVSTTAEGKAVVSVHGEGEAILHAHVKEVLMKDEAAKAIWDEGEKDGKLGMGREGKGLRNEYFFVFYFDEQERIEKVIEFLDVKLTARLQALFGRAVALLGGPGLVEAEGK